MYYNFNVLFTGDWGLGIGDWAQSPIPNPQSPHLQVKDKTIQIIYPNILYIYFIYNNIYYIKKTIK